MNQKKIKQLRKEANKMATTENQYIVKTDITVDTNDLSGQAFQVVKTQQRLLDTSPKRILKLMKKGSITPECWETETLLKNGYKLA